MELQGEKGRKTLGQTIVEKILARASRKKAPGDLSNAKIDFAWETILPHMAIFKKTGAEKVFDKGASPYRTILLRKIFRRLSR